MRHDRRAGDGVHSAYSVCCFTAQTLPGIPTTLEGAEGAVGGRDKNGVARQAVAVCQAGCTCCVVCLSLQMCNQRCLRAENLAHINHFFFGRLLGDTTNGTGVGQLKSSLSIRSKLAREIKLLICLIYTMLHYCI